MGPQFMYIYGVPSQSVVTFRFTGRTSYAIDWGLWCDRDAIRNLIASMYFGGAFFGTTVGG